MVVVGSCVLRIIYVFALFGAFGTLSAYEHFYSRDLGNYRCDHAWVVRIRTQARLLAGCRAQRREALA